MPNAVLPRILGPSMLVLLSSIALAQGPPSENSCSGITDDAQRLACYDTLFKKVPAERPRTTATSPAQTSAPAQAPPQSVSAAAPGGEFGVETRHPKGGPKRLNALVTGVTPIGRGLYRLTLDNGQVWDTTQADSALELQTSDRVTISRMMLGNYLIGRAGEGRTVAVKRAQ